MKFFKCFILAIMFIGVISTSYSQEYGPIRIKNQDIKDLKGKTLFIPPYEPKSGFCKTFIDPSAFKDFKNEKKIQDEYQRRWDSAIKASTYDLTSYEFKYIDREKYTKEKDKVTISLFFDHDFYDNWYAYLAVFEPKYQIIAVAPINGIDLANIQELKTMMNVLTYSMFNTYSFYGDDAKALYRGHQNEYREFVNSFSDTLKTKVFLIPIFDKERKKFQKHNHKLGEFIKQNWKLSKFEFLPPAEYKKRVAEGRPNDYYIKSFNINTDNSIITYHYFAIMTTTNNEMIHGFMGLQYLNSNNLKYFQINTERWLYKFMDKRKKDKYEWITPPPKEVTKKATAGQTKAKKPPQAKAATPAKTSKSKTTTPTKQAPKQVAPTKSTKPVKK